MSRLSTFVAVAFLVAACGTPAADDVATTGITDPATTTPTIASGGTDEFRMFDVDGATVTTRLALADLPARATVVEFAGTLIDSGDGPELCLGGVAASLPPQCGGPVVEGLIMGDWAERASGVTWGDRNVTVQWPPVAGRLTLIRDAPFDPTYPAAPGDDVLPVECEGIERFTPVDTLAAFADANPDRTAVVSVVRGGSVGVLRITGDRDAIAAELSDGDTVPCLIEVDYSTTQLRALQEDLNELFGTDVYLESTGSGNAANRVSVTVSVADLQTVRQIVAVADDPGMLSISGSGSILEGD